MAHHGGTGVPGQESPSVFYSLERVEKNNAALYRIRQFTAILTGCLVGVLGWTGLWGFLVYIAASLLTSLYLASRMKFRVSDHFRSNSELFGSGCITGGLLSFILFWTLVYDSIWIF
eukprot:TRINITY_DN941_c0_g1_i1.p2 TRINITY_DN941_c0_g1~~TRINITY_DN941_c0_g1_i1.p2  ORF type:complete len:130 (+),score=36.29 TRINITY_DN941_c0_g1_i1:40-390(+)